jgi:5-methyltetrahydrofolate--homocysteine methyltransferase
MQKEIIKAPFTGAGEVLSFACVDLIKYLNKRVLFRSRWKMQEGGEEYLQNILSNEEIMDAIRPQAVYGYFTANRDSGALLVNKSIKWVFPKVKDVRITDHFRTKSRGEDILPMIAVTIGEKAVRLSKEYYEKNDYAEYFLLYGLVAELAETLTAIVHKRINKELGIRKSLRRSFGYPACPDLSYQKDLLYLLEADRIGLSLSEYNQLIPEFSTTALVICDPEAKK